MFPHIDYRDAAVIFLTTYNSSPPNLIKNNPRMTVCAYVGLYEHDSNTLLGEYLLGDQAISETEPWIHPGAPKVKGPTNDVGAPFTYWPVIDKQAPRGGAFFRSYRRYYPNTAGYVFMNKEAYFGLGEASLDLPCLQDCRELTRDEDIISAMRRGPTIAQVTIVNEETNLRALYEFPVKGCNFWDVGHYWQPDTACLYISLAETVQAVPDPRDRLKIGWAVFNNVDADIQFGLIGPVQISDPVVIESVEVAPAVWTIGPVNPLPAVPCEVKIVAGRR